MYQGYTKSGPEAISQYYIYYNINYMMFIKDLI